MVAEVAETYGVYALTADSGARCADAEATTDNGANDDKDEDDDDGPLPKISSLPLEPL